MQAPDHEPPAPESKPAELPSYGLEEDAPTGWRAWLRGARLVVLLLIVALLAAAALGARPLYREAKARRALALTEQAGQALDRGDSAAASNLLRQAALMAFNDERVSARVTYHAARMGDMASVAEIGKRLADGRADTAETLVFGERSLGAGRIEDAGRALAALPATLPPDDARRRAVLEAGVKQAGGDGAAAAATLRDELARQPGTESDGLRIMLARVLLETNAEDARDEARSLLEQVASGTGDEGAQALRLLAASQAGLGEANLRTATETLERLRSHPSGEPGDEVLAARLVIASDPSKKDEAVAGLVTRLRERGADADTRAAAARWLVGIRENQAVLDLIGPDEPAVHAGALMVTLDALSGLERWDECGKLLEATRGGTLPDTLYHLFRARIAESRNDAQEADKEKRQLRNVMQFAELPHVLFAARYAESVGWKPEAFAAWRILAADEGARAEALRAQLRNLPDTLPAAEGADIAGQLLELAPQDPTARLSSAFYNLLAGREVEAAAATAEEFLAAEPQSTDVRRVAALARLRTGRAAEGLGIYPDDNGEPRWRALHAALLRAAGKTAAAEKMTEGIDPERLTPEERALLRTAGDAPQP